MQAEIAGNGGDLDPFGWWCVADVIEPGVAGLGRQFAVREGQGWASRQPLRDGSGVGSPGFGQDLPDRHPTPTRDIHQPPIEGGADRMVSPLIGKDQGRGMLEQHRIASFSGQHRIRLGGPRKVGLGPIVFAIQPHEARPKTQPVLGPTLGHPGWCRPRDGHQRHAGQGRHLGSEAPLVRLRMRTKIVDQRGRLRPLQTSDGRGDDRRVQPARNLDHQSTRRAGKHADRAIDDLSQFAPCRMDRRMAASQDRSGMPERRRGLRWIQGAILARRDRNRSRECRPSRDHRCVRDHVADAGPVEAQRRAQIREQPGVRLRGDDGHIRERDDEGIEAAGRIPEDPADFASLGNRQGDIAPPSVGCQSSA